MKKLVAIRKNGSWIIDSFTEQIYVDNTVSEAKIDEGVTRIVVANIINDYLMEWTDREEIKKTS